MRRFFRRRNTDEGNQESRSSELPSAVPPQRREISAVPQFTQEQREKAASCSTSQQRIAFFYDLLNSIGAPMDGSMESGLASARAAANSTVSVEQVRQAYHDLFKKSIEADDPGIHSQLEKAANYYGDNTIPLLDLFYLFGGTYNRGSNKNELPPNS